jgi:uncharacterized protein with PIN domain
MRFLLDAMLGDVARILRMCGHDAAYCLDRDFEADDELLALADDEDRVLVTRDRQLAAREPGALLVESKDADEQLRELAGVGVDLELTPGERCGACNGRLERVTPERAETEDRPDYVPDDADPLWRCGVCGQFFWRGSHWDDVQKRLRRVREAIAE